MKKFVATLPLLFLSLTTLKAQEIIEKVKEFTIKVEENLLGDTSSKPNYLIYPTLAYSPETKWEFGLINLLLFYAKNDKSNRLSEVNTFTFITQKGQYGLWLEHAIYSHRDRYFFLGNAKFQYFPLKFYGVGNSAPADNYTVVEANNIQIRERVLTQVKKNVFAGIQLDYHQLSNVRLSNNNIQTSEKQLNGLTGSFSNGVGISLVYDERKNVLNERHSKFAEIGILNYSSFLGSTYNFSKVFAEGRKFTPGIGKNQVFAMQALAQLSFGEIPFNMYSMMGGESLMRGYYLGRFRDNHLIAAQAEYRFLPFSFSKRIGAAFFASAGSVQSQLKQYNLNDLKIAGGAGLRYLIFTAKDIFIRFDVAFTNESAGYYLFIGEAF